MSERSFRFNVFLCQRIDGVEVALDSTNKVISNQLDAVIIAYLSSDDWKPGETYLRIEEVKA